MKQSIVLIVEDSNATRDYYQSIIEPYGIVIEQGYNGIEGIEKYLQTSVDAIIIDINMPKMDGIACIKQIRELEDPHITPVIVISSQSHAKDKQMAYEAGANAYLVKPTPADQLLQVLMLLGIQLGRE